MASAALNNGKDAAALASSPTAGGSSAPQQSYFQQALGVLRASCVFGVILGATATNVTVAMAIHAFTRDRKKAQGPSGGC